MRNEKKWDQDPSLVFIQVDTKGGGTRQGAWKKESGDKDRVARCLTNELRFREGRDSKSQWDGSTEIDHSFFI